MYEDNMLEGINIVAKMPVTVKGDTIIYNADSFKNGSERKLKDVLEKLPGVEINDAGQIEVEGKAVEKIMVDGKEKRPKSCAYEDTEHPDWPTDYTYLDQFLDEMKEQNGGEVVFVATTIGDYETMSMNMQEVKRYIKQLGQVVVYYRDVTIKTPEGDKKGVGVKIETKD